MEVEAQKSPIIRRPRRTIIISVVSVCVIVAICVGVYFLVRKKDSTQFDDEDDILNESTPQTFKWVNNEEIKIFRRFLRFKTVTLESDLGPCVEFLKRQGNDLNMAVSVHYPTDRQNPVLLMTWEGSQPELPSILLNSHIDVVPVAEEYWNYSPFAAQIAENGDIYARGTQDMKSVGMQYLAAIRAMRRNGTDRLKRTIHLTYVPDEESGGSFGMGAFVKTNDFKNLNVGCALDEGYPSATDELEVYNTERTSWSINITTHGHSGHASLLFNDTAVEKLNYIMNRFLEFRKDEARKLNEMNLPYGNVTSINLTILKGGFKSNVVPPEMNAYIDMRVSVNSDWNELEQTINRWMNEAGNDTTLDIEKGVRAEPTRVDITNPYWMAFKSATDQLGIKVKAGVFRAATDSRYIRQLNIPALGFSPLMNTLPMLHEHNEKVDVEPPQENEDLPVEEKGAGADIITQTTYGKLFQATWRLLEEYCSNSSLHGVRYFVEKKRHWMERFWWIFGFVISICCCSALIHKIYVNWDEKSVIISFAGEVTPVYDIPFPAVTICPNTKIDIEQFDLSDILDTIKDHPGSPYSITENITNEEFTIMSALNHICNCKISSNENFTDNSMANILWKIAPKLNTTLKECSFANESSECQFEEIMTDEGLCFTFNMLSGNETYYDDLIYSHLGHKKATHWNVDKGYDSNIQIHTETYPRRVFGSGADEQGLFFTLLSSVQNLKYSCYTQGYRIVLHTPGEIPQATKYSFRILPLERAYVEVKPKIITTSDGLRRYHPKRRKCYFNSERQLRFLRVYTQRNCELECLSNYTLSLCGCVSFFMPRDVHTPICGTGKIHCYDWAKKSLLKEQIKQPNNIEVGQYIRLQKLIERCNCLPACNAITYDMSMSKTLMNWNETKTSMRIVFKENEFITLMRSELYGPIDFAANCGGLLGLFIGASFLSIFELVYYCSLRLYCNRKGKINQKRRTSISDIKNQKKIKRNSNVRISTVSKMVDVSLAKGK